MMNPHDYDDIQKRCLPYWESFFGNVLDFINSDARKILEFASGSGFLTGMIAKKCPGADITCVDIDAGLIGVAKEKPALSKVRFIEGDMRNFREGGFDAVVLTQSFFALSDDEIVPFTSGIYDMLNKGGIFIVGDMFEPESSFEMDIYFKNWTGHMLKNGFSPEEAGDMLNPLDDYCRENTLSSIANDLRKAGFGEVIIPYRCGYYGVVAAYKKSGG